MVSWGMEPSWIFGGAIAWECSKYLSSQVRRVRLTTFRRREMEIFSTSKLGSLSTITWVPAALYTNFPSVEQKFTVMGRVCFEIKIGNQSPRNSNFAEVRTGYFYNKNKIRTSSSMLTESTARKLWNAVWNVLWVKISKSVQKRDKLLLFKISLKK